MGTRKIKIIVLILLTGFVLLKGVVPAWNEVHSDFGNYYVSAKLISNHTNLDSLYNDAWFHEQAVRVGAPQAVKFSPFPPITAFVMVPLTFFKVKTANRIWIVVNLLLFLPAVFIIRKITSWDYPLSLFLILASGLSLINNIKFGQVYWLMTICLLFSIWWLKQNKEFVAGFVVGIFAMLKYYSVVIFFGFWLSKFKKASIFFMLTIILLVLLQYYFFGVQVMKEFFVANLFPHLSGQISGQNPFAFEFQSWESLLLNLFCPGSPYFTHPVIDAPEIKEKVKWTINALLLLPSIYAVLNNRRTKDFDDKLALFIAIPSLAMLALLPTSATYHYILLLIPLSLLLKTEQANFKKTAILICLYVCIGYIPYKLFFELGLKWSVFLAYPRLTLITILYLVACGCYYKRIRNIESVNSFYDSIATEYDSQVKGNSPTREAVAKIFQSIVEKGTVLDFGGGTGLDLPWLTNGKYKILFLEPASKMLQIAKNRFAGHPQVKFLENNINFETWPSAQPFPEKLEGVLANFAVLNSFENNSEFFSSLSPLCNTNCNLIVTVINPEFKTMIKNYSIVQAIRITCFGKITVYNKHNDKYHPTYLHSKLSLKVAAKKWFVLKSYSRIDETNFVVIHFQKK
ncbi:MAG: DUF2029 domain-containing protein [Bacteroidetes bacterium]|nr:DUF2029 domain-containing protein [Bacteroidota bacterium]